MVRETSEQTEQAPGLESAVDVVMATVRAQVTGIFQRIEDSGLPISPELLTARNELLDLAAQAARIEFEGAEYASPIGALRGTMERVSKNEEVSDSLRESAVDALQSIHTQVQRFSQEFMAKRSALLRQDPNTSDQDVIARLFEQNNQSFGLPTYFAGKISATVQSRNDIAALPALLRELGVAIDESLNTISDLADNVRKTGRKDLAAGMPYIDNKDRDIVLGLSSRDPKLSGLYLNVQDKGGRKVGGQATVALFGNQDFWLKHVQNSPEIMGK